jgi:hypothetical protein
LGAVGFKDMCLHFESFGMMSLHSLMVALTMYCSFLVLSCGMSVKLLAMKLCTLLLYSDLGNIIRELPLSAFVSIAFAAVSCFLICECA